MPTKLGAADSFNSSGATIIPDSSSRSSQLPYRQYNPVSTLSNARLLMPEDSFGRQLNEFMRGAEVEVNENSGHRPQQGGQGINQADGEAILREFGFDTNIPSPLPYNPAANANASDLMSGLQIDPTAARNTSPFVSHSPLVANQQDQQGRFSASSNTPFDPTFRPSSAHSHRSSVSGSEFSYVSTEVSGDDDFRMDGEVPSPVQTVWNVDPAGLGGAIPGAGHGAHVSPVGALGVPKDGGHYPSPVSATGPSPPTVPGAMFGGPIRGINREEEEKQKKIEHRRDINRRSAQKHRAARKAEVEHLNRIISDKDAKVSALERDLAVEKSRSAQLAEFIRMSMGRGRTSSDASNSAESAPSDADGSVKKGSRRSKRESGA